MKVQMMRVGGLIMLLVLSACGVSIGGSGKSSAPDVGTGVSRAPETIVLSESNLTITAPQGYCIDLDSYKERGGSSFLLMASCAPLRHAANDEAHGKTTLLTVTLTPRIRDTASMTPQALAGFFQTPAGRRHLARNGQAEDLTILWSGVEDNALFLHAHDASPIHIQGLTRDYWRALTLIDGRLLSVTSAPFAQSQAPDPSAEAIVLEVIQRIRANNPRANADIALN